MISHKHSLWAERARRGGASGIFENSAELTATGATIFSIKA
jgi:hypothetical protein